MHIRRFKQLYCNPHDRATPKHPRTPTMRVGAIRIRLRARARRVRGTVGGGRNTSGARLLNEGQPGQHVAGEVLKRRKAHALWATEQEESPRKGQHAAGEGEREKYAPCLKQWLVDILQ